MILKQEAQFISALKGRVFLRQWIKNRKYTEEDINPFFDLDDMKEVVEKMFRMFELKMKESI